MICHLPGLVAVLEAKTEKCVETGDRGTKGEGGRGRVGSGVSSSLRPGQGRGREEGSYEQRDDCKEEPQRITCMINSGSSQISKGLP